MMGKPEQPDPTDLTAASDSAFLEAVTALGKRPPGGYRLVVKKMQQPASSPQAKSLVASKDGDGDG